MHNKLYESIRELNKEIKKMREQIDSYKNNYVSREEFENLLKSKGNSWRAVVITIIVIFLLSILSSHIY